MNTPKPCDTCTHLYWDCMREDDDSYTAECKLGHRLGDRECPDYHKAGLKALRKEKGE